jgi:tryptophanyl-tRNA synthetase
MIVCSAVILKVSNLTNSSGAGGKMSASVPMSAIFLDDTPNQIKKKINASFSGGQETKELHQELGGNPDVDVPYQYLCYFEVCSPLISSDRAAQNL